MYSTPNSKNQKQRKKTNPYIVTGTKEGNLFRACIMFGIYTIGKSVLKRYHFIDEKPLTATFNAVDYVLAILDFTFFLLGAYMVSIVSKENANIGESTKIIGTPKYRIKKTGEMDKRVDGLRLLHGFSDEDESKKRDRKTLMYNS